MKYSIVFNKYMFYLSFITKYVLELNGSAFAPSAEQSKAGSLRRSVKPKKYSLGCHDALSAFPASVVAPSLGFYSSFSSD